ncbi:MAG TPA: hypothetical protein VEI82_04750, partial [Myxococcota bacterium]|nr:hypothetical protein [Myxococcota bacterium]
MTAVIRPETFWAERLGCAESAFAEPGPTLLTHPRGHALYAFATRGSLVVLAPPALHAVIRRLEHPRSLVTPEAVRALGPAVSRL